MPKHDTPPQVVPAQTYCLWAMPCAVHLTQILLAIYGFNWLVVIACIHAMQFAHIWLLAKVLMQARIAFKTSQCSIS